MNSEEQDINTPQTISIGGLKQDLKDVKIKEYTEIIRKVKKDLYLSENGNAEIEALLIKATEDKFGSETLKTDSVLVAFGLVQGYGHYGQNNFDTKKQPITERYKKFLLESGYISKESEYTKYSSYEEADKTTEKSKKRDGTIVDKKALDIIRSSLGTNVGRWIEEVADYLNKKHTDEQLSDYLSEAVRKYPSTNPDHIPDNELPPLRNPRKDSYAKKDEANSCSFLETETQNRNGDDSDNTQTVNPLGEVLTITEIDEQMSMVFILLKIQIQIKAIAFIKKIIIALIVLISIVIGFHIFTVNNKNSEQVKSEQIQYNGVTYSDIQNEDVSMEDAPLDEPVFKEVSVHDDEGKKVKYIHMGAGESNVLVIHFSPNDAPRSKLHINSENTSILNIKSLDAGIPGKLPFLVKVETREDIERFPTSILVQGQGAVPACVNVYIAPNSSGQYNNEDVRNGGVLENGGLGNAEQ